MSDGVLRHYTAVLKHLETLRFEIAENRGQHVFLKGPAARAAVEAAVLRGPEAYRRGRPAIPVTAETIEFLEERLATEFEGQAYALAFPLLRDPTRGVLKPLWVFPLDVFEDGRGNVRVARRLSPLRSGGAIPGAEPETYWKERPEDEVLGERIAEMDLETTGDLLDDLAAAGDRAEGLEPVADTAALYTYLDADFMFNLRKDYESLKLDAESCLPAVLEGGQPSLEGTAPPGVALGGRRLTPSQNAAVERIFSQRVTPIEGPPGTGKTTLIANLCARAIVDRARCLAGLQKTPPLSILVTSTNNKAVRNVSEALAAVSTEGPHAPGVFAGGRREMTAEAALRLRELVATMSEELDPGAHAKPLRKALSRNRESEGAELLHVARRYLYYKLAGSPRLRRLKEALEAHAASAERGQPRRWAGLLEEHDALKAFQDLCPVVTCTSLSVRNVLPLATCVELAIIDEAAQTMLPYALPVFARARRAAVIGDENQLRPILDLPNGVLSDLADGDPPEPRLSFGQSALGAVWERERDKDVAGQSLKEHFRCREPIIRFCDRVCGYGLEVRTPDRGLGVELGLPEGSLLEVPVVLLDVPSEHERVGGSYRNEKEAGAAVEYVRRVLWSVQGRLNGRDLRDLVGVVTPFRAQAWLLRSILRRDRELGALWRRDEEGRRFTVGTVHALQGDEKPVVVLSMVIAAKGPGGFAFLNESRNLLNVAVSRARQQLVIAADASRLAAERGPWVRELWRHVESLEREGRARRITVKDLADPRLW